MRTYNSQIGANGRLGFNWTSNYGDPTALNTLSINTQSTPNVAQVPRPDGRVLFFRLLNGVWTPDADITDTLTRTSTGWTYTLRDGTAETYDNTTNSVGNSTGRLIAITNPAGLTHTLSYDPTTGYLSFVTDAFGHSLALTYDTGGRLHTMIDPNGGITTYTYDDTNNVSNLSSVTYPDAKARSYKYNEPGYVTAGTNFPHALTGIYDENNDRYASLTYDTAGRVIVNQLADVGSGPQKKFTLTYNSATQTTVTDAANTQEVMTFSTNLGVKNLVSKRNLADNKVLTQTFDGNNNLTCKQEPAFGNESAHVTTWTYYASNQKQTMTEGLTGTCTNPQTTAATRTTSYQYLSPTLDLPTLIQSPSVYGGGYKTVTIGYNDSRFPLLPTTITQSGYTPAGVAVSRSVTLGYNSFGAVHTIDGPRTDVNDITTLNYYNCTTGGGCGQLQSVTNSLGQTTTYDYYDGAGRVTQTTDPNGLVTVYGYDERGRVKTITETPAGGTARVTSFTYHPAGMVATSTDPDGVVLRYQYDAALQLRHVLDPLNNDHAYAYDTRGNPNAESLYDASGTLVRTEGRVFDARNHLWTVTRGGVVTTTVNDALGVLRSLTDGNNHTTTYTPDALNRVFQMADAVSAAAGKATSTGYDVNDRVVSVQAPNSATTLYSVDDLGNVLSEFSPDRGTTGYSYDAAGNVLQVTNALGQVTSYTYDALNRVTSQQSSATNTPRYDYVYDNCGAGRLCWVTRNNNFFLYFQYDGFGRRTYEVSSANLYALYGYSAAGRLSSITYNDARVVNYLYDTAGQVREVDTTANGVTTTLASNIQYYPFGPVKSLTYGNGRTLNQFLDTAYRPTQRFDGSFFESVTQYDGADNILTLWAPNQKNYGYDAANRLNAVGLTSYTYDLNGNRQSITGGGTTTTYSYAPSTNRLASVGGDTRILDAAGNTTSTPALGTLAYDGYGRLRSALTGSVSYGYDAFNRRLSKTVGSTTTRYHYGPSGELLYETDGTNLKAYVYLNGVPLARIDNGSAIYYYHTDHLGTPQAMTDSTGTVVWAASYPPFGNATITTQTIVNNLRFPGQYYDAETGLHYNWNRYYDPKTGRYITSDPIGLKGGLNTYAYVHSNPLVWYDPSGLIKCTCQARGGGERRGGEKICTYLCHCHCSKSPEEFWFETESSAGSSNDAICMGQENTPSPTQPGANLTFEKFSFDTDSTYDRMLNFQVPNDFMDLVSKRCKDANCSK